MKVAVEFGTAHAATHALRTLKSLGYVDIETHAPFPLPDADADSPRGSLALGVPAFAGGLFALGAAYVVQWWANVWSYPLNIGGRPVHAGPAFVPATFETICLVVTATVLLAFLVFERLPRLWQPLFEIEGFERATVDRFWLVLDVDASKAMNRVTSDIVPLRPIRVVVGEEEA